jgi:hypothetical protein
LLQFLRASSGEPGRPEAILAGDADGDWLRRGAGLCSVYSRQNKSRSSLFRLDAGLRLYAGRKALDPSSWISCWCAVLLLIQVLQWTEPDAVGWQTADNSINKADVLCRSGAGGQDSGSPFVARHGDVEQEGFGASGCRWPDLFQGSSDASPGSFFTMASSPSFFLVEWRPLPPSASVTVAFPGRRQMEDFNLQALMLHRRPLVTSAAGSHLSVPSGIVPGDVEAGCAELQSRLGGEGAGPDCFFLFSSKVLSAKCKGLFEISCSSEALSIRCNSTDD